MCVFAETFESKLQASWKFIPKFNMHLPRIRTFSFINTIPLPHLRQFTLFHPVQFSRSVVSDSFWPHEPQHARPPCPSPTPGVYSNSFPLSRWWHPTISSSVIPLSFCLWSFPASGSFTMSQLFASGGQSIGSFSFNMCIQHSASFQRIFRVDTCYCYMLHYE